MTLKPKRSRYIIRSRSDSNVILGTWFVPEYVSGQKGRGFRDVLVESCLVIAGPIVLKEYIEKICDYFRKTAKVQNCKVTGSVAETKSKVRFVLIGVPTITWIYGLQAIAKKGFVLEKVESFGRLLG